MLFSISVIYLKIDIYHAEELMNSTFQCSHIQVEASYCKFNLKHYRRKVTKAGAVWICSTFNTIGKEYCASKQIPESTLISITEETLGNINALNDKITAIRAEKDNTLIFCFKDGESSVKRWTDRSRRESWTPEMRETARQRTLERNKNNG